MLSCGDGVSVNTDPEKDKEEHNNNEAKLVKSVKKLKSLKVKKKKKNPNCLTFSSPDQPVQF